MFQEILQRAKQGDDEKVLTLCNQALRSHPHDVDVLHVKIISLVRLDRHQEAIQLMDQTSTHSETSVLSDELHYEKAYCLYRLHRLEECLESIHRMLQHSGYTGMKYHCLHLKAQVNDPYFDELQANVNALIASMLLDGGAVDSLTEQQGDTYELLFNLACVRIGQGRIQEAETLLIKARDTCRRVLQDEQVEEAEIQKELSVMTVQLAFVYQLQGKPLEALELYLDVLNSKQVVSSKIDVFRLGDKVMAAIASNNIMAIRKEKQVFDSMKRYKVASAKGLETKLARFQQTCIALNGAILALYRNKYTAAKDILKIVSEAQPKKELPFLISAGMTLKQKKAEKALEELKDRINTHPEFLGCRLAVAQTYIMEHRFKEAIHILQEYVEKRFLPGLVSLLIWLYGQTDQATQAMELIQKAHQEWNKQGGLTLQEDILAQVASFKLESKRFREAAADYETLVKSDPTRMDFVASLVLAYSEFDMKKAEQYVSYLTDNAMDVDESFDIEELEKGVGLLRSGNVQTPQVSTVKKPAKKRQKKKILAKNYDPNVEPDPERWLPKHERAAFAKKKGKKALMHGPQGVAIEGGGVGGTGSARIAGLKVPEAVQVPKEAVAAVSPATASTASKKKKKKK